MIEEGTIPERSIGDPTAHGAILEELDDVAAGRGQAIPTK
jgi:RNA polymerase sigma-70 factor (ECF subfamily)